MEREATHSNFDRMLRCKKDVYLILKKDGKWIKDTQI